MTNKTDKDVKTAKEPGPQPGPQMPQIQITDNDLFTKVGQLTLINEKLNAKLGEISRELFNIRQEVEVLEDELKTLRQGKSSGSQTRKN